MKTLSQILLLAFVISTPSFGWEIFGKGSVSKNNLATDSSVISVSMTGGLAINLLPWVRLEGRYSNISSLQNKLNVTNAGLLTDIKTETTIFSAGLDVEFLSEKSAFQPFVYLGAGYITTTRSYYFTPAGGSSSVYYQEPNETGISGNGGLGMRLRIAKHIAIELEVFAYGIDIYKPNPLINYQGTAGLRIYL
jgi:hypothetical protein